jgi:uncharacterized protein (TIGR02118 family)
MIKLIYCITRKEGMSVEEFQHYWRQKHAQLASKSPGLRRYVQCHTIPQQYEREAPPAYDGAAELWFDDMDAFRVALRSPEMAATREDELNFIDHSRSFLIITEENVVVD